MVVICLYMAPSVHGLPILSCRLHHTLCAMRKTKLKLIQKQLTKNCEECNQHFKLCPSCEGKSFQIQHDSCFVLRDLAQKIYQAQNIEAYHQSVALSIPAPFSTITAQNDAYYYSSGVWHTCYREYHCLVVSISLDEL